MTKHDAGTIVNITFFVAAARTPDAQAAARARVRLAARVATRDAVVLARAMKQAVKLGRIYLAPAPVAAKALGARLRDLAAAVDRGATGKLDAELLAAMAAIEAGAAPREVARALRASLRRDAAEVLVAVVPVPCRHRYAGSPA